MLHFSAELNMGCMTYFILLVLTKDLSFVMVIFLYLHGQMYLAFSSMVEVGLDDPENLSHLGHFWWVKWKTKLRVWMCPRVLIDHMFIRKWDLHLVSKFKRILRPVNWRWIMHWIITGMKPAYYLKLFWSMWCPEILLSKLGTRDQFCWPYPDCLIGQQAWPAFNPVFQGKISIQDNAISYI